LIGAQVIEATCMLTAKLGKVEELYHKKTLEAASKRFRGGIGLQELLREGAWANGYTGRDFGDGEGGRTGGRPTAGKSIHDFEVPWVERGLGRYVTARMNAPMSVLRYGSLCSGSPKTHNGKMPKMLYERPTSGRIRPWKR
jgi:hypothetical protein